MTSYILEYIARAKVRAAIVRESLLGIKELTRELNVELELKAPLPCLNCLYFYFCYLLTLRL